MTWQVSFASFKSPDKDVAAAHVDLIMINKYHAWYSSTGQLDIVPPLVRRDVLAWRRAFHKPILVSEFGADAVAGVHAHPAVAFSEEFQADYLGAHYPPFDELRSAGPFAANRGTGVLCTSLAPPVVGLGRTARLLSKIGNLCTDTSKKLAADPGNFELSKAFRTLPN